MNGFPDNLTQFCMAIDQFGTFVDGTILWSDIPQKMCLLFIQQVQEKEWIVEHFPDMFDPGAKIVGEKKVAVVVFVLVGKAKEMVEWLIERVNPALRVAWHGRTGELRITWKHKQ